MRTTRTTVAGLLSLALIVGPGAAAAQSADSDDLATPAYVTITPKVTQTFSVPGTAGEDFPWGSRYATQGINSTLDADDPRVSGYHTIVFTVDVAPAQKVGRGTVLARIVNDGGSWEGPISIVYYPDEMEFRLGVLEGQGGYENLMLTLMYDGERGTGSQFHGLIWEGDPPPIPDAELLPD